MLSRFANEIDDVDTIVVGGPSKVPVESAGPIMY